ncbi:hypothetical protein MCP1_20170 [Candidatus Terasakiella magnetica]|nr:hypothetical protein MCP1_20170 [Candidatus Terasakiella magnetica]
MCADKGRDRGVESCMIAAARAVEARQH